MKRRLVIGALCCALLSQAQASDWDGPGKAQSDEERIARLEIAMSNIESMKTDERVQSLQTEIETMRGQIDELNHQIHKMESKQKKMYLDVDSRLSELTSHPTPPETPVAAPATQPVQAVVPEKPSPEKATTIKPEKIDYQAAFHLLEGRDYDGAKQAFTAFVDRYPNGKYIPNAYYWLGEIAMKERQYDNAMNDFRVVLDRYPRSVKAPDAALKLGVIMKNFDNRSGALRQFKRIEHDYPNSPASQLAKKLLKTMG